MLEEKLNTANFCIVEVTLGNGCLYVHLCFFQR